MQTSVHAGCPCLRAPSPNPKDLLQSSGTLSPGRFRRSRFPDKGTPVARRARIARGLPQTAQRPKEIPLMIVTHRAVRARTRALIGLLVVLLTALSGSVETAASFPSRTEPRSSARRRRGPAGTARRGRAHHSRRSWAGRSSQDAEGVPAQPWAPSRGMQRRPSRSSEGRPRALAGPPRARGDRRPWPSRSSSEAQHCHRAGGSRPTSRWSATPCSGHVWVACAPMSWHARSRARQRNTRSSPARRSPLRRSRARLSATAFAPPPGMRHGRLRRSSPIPRCPCRLPSSATCGPPRS